VDDVAAARSSLALAALASAAVPGLDPASVERVPAEVHGIDVDAAAITDELGRHWVVRAPRSAAAGLRLEAESGLLGRLAGYLPFAVPRLEGSVTLPDGGRAMVHRALPGRSMTEGDLRELATSALLASGLGRALAAIHDLPERVVAEAGLPVYDAEEHRQRRLTELDRAAATGHVPNRLLMRWERALEEAGAWRFVPAVVHGDLDATRILLDGDGFSTVGAVFGWAEARLADPADDLAWLAAAVEPAGLTAVLTAYTSARRSAPDRDLARRAELAGELALARWLLHGTATGTESVVGDAVAMLSDLDAAVGAQSW
jgi:macrolide phosphotransferase